MAGFSGLSIQIGNSNERTFYYGFETKSGFKGLEMEAGNSNERLFYNSFETKTGTKGLSIQSSTLPSSIRNNIVLRRKVS